MLPTRTGVAEINGVPSHLFKEFNMIKKRIVVALLLLAVAVSALVVNRRDQVSAAQAAPGGGGGDQKSLPSADTGQPVGDAIPEHVTYDVLFRQIAAFKKKADDADRQGRGDGDVLRKLVYQQAELSDADAEKVDKIQSQYMTRVSEIDKKARKVIEQSRLGNPNGKLEVGAQLPEPPKELKALQAQRNNLTLQARAQVGATLGEEKFKHFGEFVKEHIARKLKPVELRGRRPLNLGENDKEQPLK